MMATKNQAPQLPLECRIKVFDKPGKLRAFASVSIADCFAIDGVKVMDGEKGLFVAMPSYKGNDDKYHEICFPTTKEFREELYGTIMKTYEQTLEQHQERSGHEMQMQ